MSPVAISPEPVPLVRDNAGRLMIPGTRISLDVLVADFGRGMTPESIQSAYETVSLADVYAVLAYYLRHRGEVDAYLADQQRHATAARAQIEAEHPAEGMRAMLLARLDS